MTMLQTGALYNTIDCKTPHCMTLLAHPVPPTFGMSLNAAVRDLSAHSFGLATQIQIVIQPNTEVFDSLLKELSRLVHA